MLQDLNQPKYLHNAFHKQDLLPENGNTSATHHYPYWHANKPAHQFPPQFSFPMYQDHAYHYLLELSKEQPKGFQVIEGTVTT